MIYTYQRYFKFDENMKKQFAKRPEDPWHVSTINILSAISHGFLSELSEDILIQLSDLQYTILDQQHVYYDSLLLTELYLATGQKPKSLVAFKPKRLLLHELIVATSTMLELDDEKNELQKIVNEIFTNKNFITDIEECGVLLESRRVEINEQVIRKFIAIKNKIADRRDDNIEILINETEMQINNHIKESAVILGKYVQGFDVKQAVILLVTDKIYKNEAQQLSKIAQKYVADYAEKLQWSLIKPPIPEKRYTFMISGGQASGKGTFKKELKLIAESRGINWNAVVKINTDKYKPLVLDFDVVQPTLYSQLAHEEASVIREKIEEKYYSLMKQKTAPHILIDQVLLDVAKLQHACENNGSVVIIIVSTNVVTSVNRSFLRGEREHRFEDTHGILLGHKNVASQSISTLAKFSGQNIYTRIVDNNVVEFNTSAIIVDIDLKNKTINIFDKPKLEKFVQECSINIEAKSEQEVNDNKYQSIEDFFQPLIEKEFSIKNNKDCTFFNYPSIMK